jgi:hypothetical protein
VEEIKKVSLNQEADRLRKIAEEKAQLLAKTQAAVHDFNEMRDVDYDGCCICGLSDEPEKTLLCDGCNKAWHIFCLRPKLKVIPEGEWYCPTCSPKKIRKKWTRLIVEDESEEETKADR